MSFQRLGISVAFVAGFFIGSTAETLSVALLLAGMVGLVIAVVGAELDEVIESLTIPLASKMPVWGPRRVS